MTAMAVGQSGVIAEIQGREGIRRRLAALGLRVGGRITKESRHFHGPVTVRLGRTNLGIGQGMAAKVIVEVDP